MSIPYGYVYRIRNKINGKTYVGQRKLSRDRKWRQYMGSGIAIKAAIAKYGVNSFTKELLSYAASYDELNKAEVDAIRDEKDKGKAQYNRHPGNLASPEFSYLTDEEKQDFFARVASHNKARHRKKYQDTVFPYGEMIISLYSLYKSCKKVADELQISVKYVNRFLKESEVNLNYQTIVGRVMDDETKIRISKGVQASSVLEKPRKPKSKKPKNIFICLQCDEKFVKYDNKTPKFCSQKCSTEARKTDLPPIEIIEELYWEENLSANEIGRRYSVSGQTIRKYMKRNGVDRRERNRS